MATKNGALPQVGWRIDPELRRRLNIEAAKRGLKPARVVEEALRAMLEHVDEAPNVAD
jgi:predicted HicB family RNase H-like nuclease